MARTPIDLGNEDGDTGNDGGEFVDPANAIGTGTGSDSGSDGGDSGDGDRGEPGDDYARDGDGNVIRNKDGSPRRKRGRRKGASGGQKKVYSNLNQSVEVLSRGLLIIHASLAAVTKTPELALAEVEAKGLTEATLNLLAQYDVKPDPKIEAMLLLAGQFGIVYGTRIVAIRSRRAGERKDKAENKASVYNGDGSYAGSTEFDTVSDPYANMDKGPIVN